ncbi:MAG: CapA family protein [Lentisphaerae bacterium]|nr:CapA family protein [Lentisphaerota bacterium]
MPPDKVSPAKDRVPREVFPYAPTREAGVLPWQRIRVEGRGASYLVNPVRFVGYALKACRPKRSTAADTLAHFEKQKRLFKELACVPDPALPLNRVRLAMVGDLMWIRSGWHDFLDPVVLDYLNGHDAVLGNLETQVAPRLKVPTALPVRFLFNSSAELLRNFHRKDGTSTFSALSVANNHMLDYGDDAARQTREFLREEGIPATGWSEGVDPSPYVMFERGGIRFGFYAATYGVNRRMEQRTRLACNLLPGIAPDDAPGPADIGHVASALEAMRRDAVDFKIVSLHWGFEHEHYPEPKIMQTAREIVAAGADVIMGHHPHVQQPMEVCLVNGYESGIDAAGIPEGCRITDGTGQPRKALVLYSLGNFTTAAWTAVCRIGMMLSLVIAKKDDGKTDWYQPHCARVYNRPASRRWKRRTMWLGEDEQTDTIGSTGAQRRAAEAVRFLKELTGEF